jgi:hypothetical protein
VRPGEKAAAEEEKAWSLTGWVGGGPRSPARAEIGGGAGKRCLRCGGGGGAGEKKETGGCGDFNGPDPFR